MPRRQVIHILRTSNAGASFTHRIVASSRSQTLSCSPWPAQLASALMGRQCSFLSIDRQGSCLRYCRTVMSWENNSLCMLPCVNGSDIRQTHTEDIYQSRHDYCQFRSTGHRNINTPECCNLLFCCAQACNHPWEFVINSPRCFMLCYTFSCPVRLCTNRVY